MGTNFYVRPPQCEHPCEHCGKASEIHLGKSSGGWVFLHRGYRNEWDQPSGLDFPVTDRASWLKLLDLGPIYDEYGQLQGRDEFLSFIESTQDSIRRNSARGRDLGAYPSDRDWVDGGYEFCDAEFS